MRACVREGYADVASGARFALLAGTGGAPHTGAGTRRSGGHDTSRLAGPQLWLARKVWGATLNSQKSRYGEFYIVNILGHLFLEFLVGFAVAGGRGWGRGELGRCAG